MNNLIRPHLAALAGFLLALPFIIMNAIVATRFEPLYSFLGSIKVISASPIPTVPILIILGLLGAWVAAWPMFQKGINGKRTFYPINFLLSAVLFIGFIWIGIALGEEVYQCEIRGIVNCD